MKVRFSRFAVKLVSAAVLAVSLPASIAMAQGQRFDGVTLRVGTYGGPWGDAVEADVGKKLEAMGAKVEYVVGNPAQNFAKIVSARGYAVPIDVMEMGPAERLVMSRNGFLEDLPVDKIPNLLKLSVKVVDKTAVAHQMVENGILYRTDTFSKDKLPVPKTFEDLENPIFAGRVDFPDVTNPQHWPAVSALSSDAGGSEATPEKGFEQVLKMKPLYYSSATQLSQDIVMGNVIAAPSHAGVAIRMYNAGQPVGFVHPQIGNHHGEVEYNYLGIIKGSKNVAAAAAFINAFLGTQAQANFAKSMGVVPTNREARKLLMKDPVINRFMLLSDKDIANTYTMDWNKVNVEKWRAAWVRTVSK